MRSPAALSLALLLSTPGAAAPPPTGTIDAEHSRVEVEVSRSGILSTFGHDHRITAPVSSGFVRSDGGPLVEVAFDTRSLSVADPGLSDADREKVRATMEGPDVLDAARYPVVVFRSTSVDAVAGGWSVEGSLTLHGATHPVRARVSLTGRHYRGVAALKLMDFGVRPPVVAGGTVRVRDEVRIVFDVAVTEPGA